MRFPSCWAFLGLIVLVCSALSCAPDSHETESSPAQPAVETRQNAVLGNLPTGIASGHEYAYGFEPAPSTENILLMAVNFQDDTSEQATLQAMTDGMFNNADSYAKFIEEVSNNQTTVTGDVYGYLTMPFNVADCDPDEAIYEGLYQLMDQGVDLTQYSKHILLANTGICAGYGGNGYPAVATAKPAMAQNNTYGIRHEMGHTYGLLHNHRYDNCSLAGTPSSSTCSGVAYGHKADVMGHGTATWAHFNPSSSELLGWMNTNTSPNAIKDVTTSGTYTISAVADLGTGDKALKIPVDFSAGDGQRSYLVEYRQGVNFDSRISGAEAQLAQGVLISIVQTEDAANNMFQIDLTPSTSGDSTVDDALAFGSSYTDPTTGIVITANSGTATTASVSVTMPTVAGPCVPAAPTIVATPVWNKREVGQAEAFELQITNNDSGCGPTSFDLSATGLETGWTYRAAPKSIPLNAGATGRTLMHVTSDSAATVGDRTITFRAEDANDTTHFGTGTATFNLTDCVHALGTWNFVDTDLAAYPSERVYFDVEYTNNNTGDCASINLQPDELGPEGWSLGLNSSGYITSGQTVTIQSSVRPPSGTATGQYTIGGLIKHLRSSAGDYQPGLVQNSITVDVADCAERAPDINLIPSVISTDPGESWSYTVFVYNENSGTCPTDESYDVEVTAPAGWTVVPPTQTVTITAGGFDNPQFVVTPPVTETQGEYTITGTATAQGTGKTRSDTGVYRVNYVEPCTEAAPTVTFQTPVSGAPGDAVPITVTVQNNDSDTCPQDTYTLSASGDADLSFGFDTTTLDINPGTVLTATLTVTSDVAASNGSKTFSVTATEAGSGSNTGNGEYIVSSVPVCASAAPSVAVSPSTQSGNPGEAKSYTVTVTNNDGANCSTKNFGLSATGASLSAGFANNTLAIVPGGTNSTTVTITPDGAATDGTYPFTVTASQAQSGTGQDSANYEVSTTCVRAAPTVELLPVALAGRPNDTFDFTLQITNNDSLDCGSSSIQLSSSGSSELNISAPTSVNISAGGTTTVTVSATKANAGPPPPGSQAFTITANPANSPSASDSGEVIFLRMTCVQSNPTVMVTPQGSSTVSLAGQPVVYDVSITNNHSAQCGTANFEVSLGNPASWTASTDWLQIAGGATAVATITVSSPGTEPDGTTNLTFDVIDETTPTYGVNTQGSYTIYTPICVPAAPTVSISPGTQSGQPGDTVSYTATITNNDSSDCASKTFTLSETLPGDISGGLSANNVTLTPSASTTVPLIVTISNAAADAQLSLSVTADEAASGNATGSAQLVVMTPQMDMGMGDMGGSDMGTGDMGPADMGGSDMGPADMGGSDMGQSDMGAADMGVSDMPADADMPASDMDVVDMAADMPTSSDMNAMDMGGTADMNRPEDMTGTPDIPNNPDMQSDDGSLTEVPVDQTNDSGCCAVVSSEPKEAVWHWFFALMALFVGLYRRR